MLFRLALLVLRLHILKKAWSLRLPERLRYLNLSRCVHGASIPVLVILFILWATLVVCCLFPRVEVALHWADAIYPEDRTIMLVLSVVFSVCTVFSALMIRVLFITREMLAMYWLLTFMAQPNIASLRP